MTSSKICIEWYLLMITWLAVMVLTMILDIYIFEFRHRSKILKRAQVDRIVEISNV